MSASQEYLVVEALPVSPLPNQAKERSSSALGTNLVEKTRTVRKLQRQKRPRDHTSISDKGFPFVAARLSSTKGIKRYKMRVRSAEYSSDSSRPKVLFHVVMVLFAMFLLGLQKPALSSCSTARSCALLLIGKLATIAIRLVHTNFNYEQISARLLML